MTRGEATGTFPRPTLDLRGYQAVGSRCVLALGAMWERVDGDVPFDRLAMPDGVSRLRGVEKGWLRDRQQFVAQSELRFPTPWWISGVAFAEMGKVGDDFEELGRKPLPLRVGRWGQASSESRATSELPPRPRLVGDGMGGRLLREAF
jgi:outer membrane protein assembly factor BamA